MNAIGRNSVAPGPARRVGNTLLFLGLVSVLALLAVLFIGLLRLVLGPNAAWLFQEGL